MRVELQGGTKECASQSVTILSAKMVRVNEGRLGESLER